MVLEKRTYISDSKFLELLSFLQNRAIKQDVENQAIYTYHTEGDFRLIKTKKYVKLDLKANDSSEEKVFVSKQYEENLINMLFKLGMDIEVKRYRTRYRFIIDNFYITLDNYIKSGNILRVRIEKEEDKESLEERLIVFLKEIGVDNISLDKANELYTSYRTNWPDLIKNIKEEEFLEGDK